MGRFTFSDVNALPDALDQVAFKLLLGQLPGVGNSLGLSIVCQSATIPGFSNETFEQGLHGHVFKFRGRKMFTRTLSVTFAERSDLSVYRALKIWDEYIAGTETGTSRGDKRDYSVQAELNVYNGRDITAGRIIFDNLFLQEVSDVTLDGQSSTAVQVQAMFSFDRMRLNGVSYQ